MAHKCLSAPRDPVPLLLSVCIYIYMHIPAHRDTDIHIVEKKNLKINFRIKFKLFLSNPDFPCAVVTFLLLLINNMTMTA